MCCLKPRGNGLGGRDRSVSSSGLRPCRIGGEPLLAQPGAPAGMDDFAAGEFELGADLLGVGVEEFGGGKGFAEPFGGGDRFGEGLCGGTIDVVGKVPLLAEEEVVEGGVESGCQPSRAYVRPRSEASVANWAVGSRTRWREMAARRLSNFDFRFSIELGVASRFHPAAAPIKRRGRARR